MKKITKKSSHPGCFFCRTGLMRYKAGKTSGPVLLPQLSRKVSASGKITNARATAQPILFYRLSPEAARMTSSHTKPISRYFEQCREAQRPVRARGREPGL